MWRLRPHNLHNCETLDGKVKVRSDAAEAWPRRAPFGVDEPSIIFSMIVFPVLKEESVAVMWRLRPHNLHNCETLDGKVKVRSDAAEAWPRRAPFGIRQLRGAALN